MEPRRVCFIAALTLLTGCTTNLTPEGRNVRLISDYADHNCTFIEEISAFDTFSSTVEKEKKSSLYELMNKAAEIGGNAIIAGEHETSVAGTEIKGLVFKCNFKRDKQMPTV